MTRVTRASLIACAAALAAVVAVAAEAPAAGPRPRAVPVDPVADVGAVPRGDKITHEFVIRNDGDAVLEITEVRPSCGCTVAEFDAQVPAGGSGRVRAVIDTSAFKGPIAKSVNVLTNDPDNPRIVLVVKANVRLHVQVQPGYARFVMIAGEKAEPVVQTLSSDERPPLEVVQVESPVPYIRATASRAAGEDDKGTWQVVISLARDAPTGSIAERVKVTTNNPRQRVVEIPVAGFVRPRLVVSPPVADFGKRELAEPFLARLEVRNNTQAAIGLTSVESDLPGVEATIKPLQEGRQYQLEVTLRPQVAAGGPGVPKGEFRGKITIHTTSAEQPVVEVEVKGTLL